MTMREGEHLICSNPDCRCEVVVVVSAPSPTDRNPICTCGFALRKVYVAPTVRTIRNPDEVKELQEMFFSKIR
jgi:hypothetical protein